MITVEDVIKYIERNINSFEYDHESSIVNDQVYICFYRTNDFNRVTIAKRIPNTSYRDLYNIGYTYIRISDMDKKQIKKLEDLFETIENRIKKEIESEILSI